MMLAPQKDRIKWDADRPLKWSDFKGTPDPNSEYGALTYSGFRYSYQYKSGPEGTEVLFDVETFFDKNSSWVRKETDALLRHEQIHFDITELHARRLRKALRAYKVKGSETFEEDIKEIAAKVNRERDEMQNLYDSETNHSLNTEEQRKWEGKVAKLLQSHKRFAE